MKNSHSFAPLALVLMTAIAAFAGDEQKPAEQKPTKEKHAAGPGMMMPMVQIKIPGVEWTDDQKEKIKEFQKEMAPKIMANVKKMEDILTDEQKKARKEALDAVKSAGKTPKEAMDALRDAVKLTDDQKKQQAEIQKEMKTLQREFMKNVMGLLTPEQLQQIKENQQSKHEDKPAEKKSADKDSSEK